MSTDRDVPAACRRAAAHLREHPEQWIQQGMGADENSHYTSIPAKATRCCALGRLALELELESFYDLGNVLPLTWRHSLTVLNDFGGREEAAQALDDIANRLEDPDGHDDA